MPRRTAAIAVGVATAAVTAVGLSFFRAGKPLVIVSAAVVGVAGVAVSARSEGEENDANAYIKSGNAKYGIGDYQGSIEDFSKALIIDPQYALAYYNRGNAKDELEAVSYTHLTLPTKRIV